MCGGGREGERCGCGWVGGGGGGRVEGGGEGGGGGVASELVSAGLFCWCQHMTTKSQLRSPARRNQDILHGTGRRSLIFVTRARSLVRQRSGSAVSSEEWGVSTWAVTHSEKGNRPSDRTGSERPVSR